jgi:hypothetical protein
LVTREKIFEKSWSSKVKREAKLGFFFSCNRRRPGLFCGSAPKHDLITNYVAPQRVFVLRWRVEVCEKIFLEFYL